ncbi:hypothetical protein CYMTET_11220 [Cymbomonas tetramitiformis]|uniref:Rhodanese domain-containing protein n=1 Tax=Cymbomonas tetramitiformis TaxID=36881 RepID=A0AAE0LD18_9CHLO|nr:hypothetical protein CYMTET_11220 [Cymbomonas tetramitiformis]
MQFAQAKAQVGMVRVNLGRPTSTVRVQRKLPVRSSGRVTTLRCVADDLWQSVPVASVKDLIDDRGFVIIDIRSPQERNETGSKHSWKSIPLAAMTEKGPVSNPNFLADVKQEFPNTMSRIIIACDDGTFRSEVAAKNITEKLGYTQVKVLEGGLDAYTEVFPYTDADKIKWKMQDQPGHDLSELVYGVDTRQPGQKFY